MSTKRPTALERDVIAWTRARLRLDEALMSYKPLEALEAEYIAATAELTRRGVKLMEKGGAHA